MELFRIIGRYFVVLEPQTVVRKY